MMFAFGTPGPFEILLVLFVIIMVGITNTFRMIMYERVREIGTMRAMGFGFREVVGLFMWEGALIGVFGSLVGVAGGVGVSMVLDFLALDMTDMMPGGFNSILPMRMILYTDIDWVFVVRAAVLGIGVSLLATLIPARRAAKVQPADALRHI